MDNKNANNNAINNTDTAANKTSRAEQIRAYLEKLNAGETLESVREDFSREFGDVDSQEIMKAEQQLMQEGVPYTEVQKLCDVHSALFHRNLRKDSMVEATSVKGHPIATLMKENEKLTQLIDKIQSADGDELEELLEQISEISVHYAKKGDLLYPHLKTAYGISGPSSVMWGVDDEIRDEINRLVRDKDRNEVWHARLKAVLKRAEEMIYKENNILFPNCTANFTEDEWKMIYRDAKQYAFVFGVIPDVWEDAELDTSGKAVKTQLGSISEARKNQGEGEMIYMPGGQLTTEQLTALLNTIPVEISFIDENDINRYFNEGPKVFKRPAIALGREVYSCHPPRIEEMVRAIIDGFKSGNKDKVDVWMEKGDRPMLVSYMAVHTDEGRYLGTAEFVYDCEEVYRHFKERG